MNTLVSVASVASASAVASPSIALPASADAAPAAAAAGICSFPELAAEVAAVRERWKQWRILDDEGRARAEAKANAATGITLRDARAALYTNRKLHDKYYEIYSEAYKEDPPDEHGDVLDVILDDISRVCDEVARQPLLSLADLGVLAQAFAMNHHESWTDGTHTGAAVTIEAVAKFAGVELFPGMVVEPYGVDDYDDGDDVGPVTRERKREPDPVFKAIE